ANQVTPTAEQKLLANLTLEVAQLKAAKSSD
ncbi:phage infection protein, partial [Lacticaseibacillus rhamnosus]